MKQVQILVVLLLLSFWGLAQKAWDSTHRPNKFLEQVQKFKEADHSRKDVVFLGNSITAGTNWAQLLDNEHAKNRGISGDITFGVLERLDEVISGKPKNIFLLIGINDISRNIPDSVITANLDKIVSRIKKGSPKTRVFLQTVLPVNNTFKKFSNHYNKDEHIAAVNSALKQIASKYKVKLIDLHSQFLDDEGRMKKELTYDGLHLNEAGYKLWAKILQEGRYIK